MSTSSTSVSSLMLMLMLLVLILVALKPVVMKLSVLPCCGWQDWRSPRDGHGPTRSRWIT